MIDTHCHLTDPRLSVQLADVLARANEAGIVRMVTVGTDLADSAACVELCRKHPQVRCAVGIHPHNARPELLSQVEQLRAIQSNGVVLAIGEIGLDYHYDFAPRDAQRWLFEAQLALAGEVGRPIVIHCREAVDDTLAILRAARPSHALFHCFTGSMDEAARVLDAGHLLGIAGPVTFRKSDELRRIVRWAPLDRFVLETDAPYLSPEPMRKQRTNEPALLVHTARAVAMERSMAVEQLADATTRTAAAFYRCDWEQRSPELGGVRMDQRPVGR